MKILSTSALAAIVAFGAIAGSAPSEAQEAMTKEKLMLKSPRQGIGLWPSTPLEKLQLLLL